MDPEIHSGGTEDTAGACLSMIPPHSVVSMDAFFPWFP